MRHFFLFEIFRFFFARDFWAFAGTLFCLGRFLSGFFFTPLAALTFRRGAFCADLPTFALALPFVFGLAATGTFLAVASAVCIACSTSRRANSSLIFARRSGLSKKTKSRWAVSV